MCGSPTDFPAAVTDIHRALTQHMLLVQGILKSRERPSWPGRQAVGDDE